MSAMATTLVRKRVHEIMDSPDLPAEEHHQALAGLRTINRWSLVARSFLPHVVGLARSLGRSELHLLDIACGGGDVPIALARLAEQRGIALRLTLVDQSAVALERASAAAGPIRHEVLQSDVFQAALPEADVVTNSLFLHHLDPPEVTAALARMAGAARHLLLVSDLQRSRLHLATAVVLCRLFSSSEVVRHDGPASVRAAFTPGELIQMATQAGMGGAEIARVFPFRMVLAWRRGLP